MGQRASCATERVATRCLRVCCVLLEFVRGSLCVSASFVQEDGRIRVALFVDGVLVDEETGEGEVYRPDRMIPFGLFQSPEVADDSRSFFGLADDVFFWAIDDPSELSEAFVREHAMTQAQPLATSPVSEEDTTELSATLNNSPSDAQSAPSDDSSDKSAMLMSQTTMTMARATQSGRPLDTVGIALIVVGVLLFCLALAALAAVLRKRHANSRSALEMSSARSEIDSGMDEPVYGSLNTSFATLD